jgi:D-alanyl-lipoteichoic acid acyltransferase DltB (MBOAT superfamily)
VLFNSVAFVFFLPAVLLLVGAAPSRLRNWIILLASYVFYGAWDWRFLGLIATSTLIDYVAALVIAGSDDRQRRRVALAASLIGNLGILGTFKYFNFFVDSAIGLIEWFGWEASRPALTLILPVGISFYTLQTMSYTIDVYYERMRATRNFLQFAVYVAYFPQLVAGPIERAQDLLPQIVSPGKVNGERVNIGLMLMMIGYTKKVLIADSIAPITAQIYDDPGAYTAGVLLQGAYLYTLQIFCDFSGYSDIARGVSELLGIRLGQNFRQPYLSQSVTEFWRRWHMSLGSWLRDYVYVPLGGNRGGSMRTYANIMATWLLCGLWHGAGWTYVAWGGLNGIYICAERALGIGRGDPPPAHGAVQWATRGVRHVVAFHLIVTTFIIFPSPSFGHIVEFVQGLLVFDRLGDIGILPFVAALAIFAIDIPQNASGDDAVFLRLPWWAQSPLYAALCFAMMLYGDREIPFIYFQF